MKKSKQPTKQPSFLKEHTQSQKKFFGGALLSSKRKSLRPLSTKDSLHFVLRSRWATGKDSFLAQRNRKAIDYLITHFAKKFGVKIYEHAINSNHIHLLLKITNRVLYRAFIKAVSGKIASQVMGQQSFVLFSRSRCTSRDTSTAYGSKQISKRGDGVPKEDKSSEKSQGFWEFRPFSRIVNWGRDFKTCVQYLKQNVLEALEFIPYKARKNHYSTWFKQIAPDLKNKNSS